VFLYMVLLAMLYWHDGRDKHFIHIMLSNFGTFSADIVLININFRARTYVKKCSKCCYNLMHLI
jgi:hypothetical protein